MLKQRVITAVLLLAVFLPALFHSDARWLAYAGLVVVTFAAWEWGSLNNLTSIQAIVFSALCFSLCTLLWMLGFQPNDVLLTWILVGCFWIFLLSYFLRTGTAGWLSMRIFFRNVIGIFALTATWFSLFQSKSISTSYLFSVLLLVCTADISAYFVGKKWGKHKLAPTISPGKSVEGLLGALVGVIVLALAWLVTQNYFSAISNNIFAKLYTHGIFALIGGVMLLTLVSAAGDLFESLIKRAAGMKDSSRLLPGHGGVLDRLDAMLPTLPLALLLYLL